MSTLHVSNSKLVEITLQVFSCREENAMFNFNDMKSGWNNKYISIYPKHLNPKKNAN